MTEIDYLNELVGIYIEVSEKCPIKRTDNSRDHSIEILNTYNFEEISIEEIKLVCQLHVDEIFKFIHRENVYFCYNEIIIFILYLFYCKNHTLRLNWPFEEKYLEKIFHGLGTAFNRVNY